MPAASTFEVVLRAENLTKVYPATSGSTEVHALDGASCELRRGEILILLGPSGSGKSTLVNILGGLDTATAGTVRYSERDLTHADEDALTEFRRQHVGFVFQFYNLIPSLTARENVALVTDIVESPMTPEKALGMVGLADRLNHFPAQLSGGEQQRVAIARAIAKQPALLLCDEPTGALDSKTGRLVLEALCAVNRELGTSVTIITHNAVIAEMGDRVLTMADGRIASEHDNAKRRPPSELSW